MKKFSIIRRAVYVMAAALLFFQSSVVIHAEETAKEVQVTVKSDAALQVELLKFFEIILQIHQDAADAEVSQEESSDAWDRLVGVLLILASQAEETKIESSAPSDPSEVIFEPVPDPSPEPEPSREPVSSENPAVQKSAPQPEKGLFLEVEIEDRHHEKKDKKEKKSKHGKHGDEDGDDDHDRDDDDKHVREHDDDDDEDEGDDD